MNQKANANDQADLDKETSPEIETPAGDPAQPSTVQLIGIEPDLQHDIVQALGKLPHGEVDSLIKRVCRARGFTVHLSH